MHHHLQRLIKRLRHTFLCRALPRLLCQPTYPTPHTQSSTLPALSRCDSLFKSLACLVLVSSSTIALPPLRDVAYVHVLARLTLVVVWLYGLYRCHRSRVIQEDKSLKQPDCVVPQHRKICAFKTSVSLRVWRLQASSNCCTFSRANASHPTQNIYNDRGNSIQQPAISSVRRLQLPLC
jgi:hypothetical protein